MDFLNVNLVFEIIWFNSGGDVEVKETTLDSDPSSNRDNSEFVC